MIEKEEEGDKMNINYWDCEFCNYDEIYTGEPDFDELRVYGCSHPDNKSKYCGIDNKWGGEEAECDLAKKQ